MKRCSQVGILVTLLLLTSFAVFAQDDQPRVTSAQFRIVQQQPELSGVFEGNIDYPKGRLRGRAAVTIMGRLLRISEHGPEKSTTSGWTIEGRIVSHKTGNYRAAVILLGDVTSPTMISVRAVLQNRGLTLMSLPWEKHTFLFTGQMTIIFPRFFGRVPEGEKIEAVKPRRPTRPKKKPGLKRRQP
jgi:hypothetical protein